MLWRRITVLIAPETAAPRDAEAAETMARALEATGGYKILRRLVLRAPPPPVSHLGHRRPLRAQGRAQATRVSLE
jgi:hypothetical protein